ncbi:hypothetical protein AKJ09_07733 [Labilithrix luteola]|uniref:Uncharacterized protein n=1 Tax=Labilithrix luteola TaxID=1391654 RepID=A0A0K1Q6N2_9BACT|nr:hypothetical protein AKJ09_07733 [Labilithrix luteola]
MACVVGHAGSSSAASGETESVHLHFTREERLAGSCPGAERFTKALRAQRPRLVLAPEDTPARTFDVHVRRVGREIAGELVIVELDGTTSRRSMQAPDCPSLVTALAVITAIAMDEPPPSVQTDDARAPGVPAIEPLSEPPSPAPEPVRSDAQDASIAPATPILAPDRSFLVAGIGTEVVLGSLPRAAMGYRGYVEWQRLHGRVAFGARLSLAFARAGLPETRKFDVIVQTWTARGEGCIARELFRTMTLEACLGASFGAYHSFNTNVPDARDDVRPWLTLDAGTRLRWHPGASPFFAEVHGAIGYVVRSYAIVADDGSNAKYEAPRGIGALGFGVGRSFDLP